MQVTAAPAQVGADLELSVVLPCLNEAETLAVCIRKALSCMAANGIEGEVLVADNGSTDGSPDIARLHGAQVVDVPERGYGAALRGGILAARGRFVIMADADDSYDLEGLVPFLSKLREGYELVMGNRFRGGIEPGAMPFLHRYLGNPILSGIGRVFFSSPVGDFHCGLRGFNRQSVLRLDLQTTGMEFASEMVVKATLGGLRITEVPTTLSPDGRSRPPHLRSWRDSWRHLRFLLAYSPQWLFFYPGLALLAVGVAVMSLLAARPVTIDGVTFDIHTMLYAAVAIIAGMQIITFYLFSRVYASGTGLLPERKSLAPLLVRFTLERGLLAGGALFAGGLAGSLYAVFAWGRTAFGALNPVSMMRLAIPSVTLLALGIQLIFSSFFLSLLTLKHTARLVTHFGRQSAGRE